MKNIFLAAFLVLLTLAALAACTAPLALLLDSMGDFHATADLADLDGDGDLDRVLFNDGAGAFVDSGQRIGDAESTAVVLGDLDGDGDADALAGAGDKAILW
ncbi:MAG: hypothetical protein KDD75_24065, partial [Caldilineaceae bacterium]|nr:hypothetical protein [Caldilineaceae bacterium]